jgi:hypothetical protein
MNGNGENIKEMDNRDAILLQHCKSLSELGNEGLLKQLGQICGIIQGCATDSSRKDVFVCSIIKDLAGIEILPLLNSVSDERFSMDDVRRRPGKTDDSFGFVCSLDTGRKLSIQMLKPCCGDAESFDIQPSDNLSDIADGIVSKLNCDIADKLMEAADSEQQLGRGSAKWHLFQALQKLYPEHYRDKLLESFYKKYEKHQEPEYQRYHNKWFANNNNKGSSIPSALVGAIALTLKMDTARRLSPLGTTNDLPSDFKFDETVTNDNSFRLCLLSRVIAEEGESGNHGGNVLPALTAEFNEICTNDHESLVLALPWLIVQEKKSIDDLIIDQAAINTAIKDELNRLCDDAIPRLATRARSISLR